MQVLDKPDLYPDAYVRPIYTDVCSKWAKEFREDYGIHAIHQCMKLAQRMFTAENNTYKLVICRYSLVTMVVGVATYQGLIP